MNKGYLMDLLRRPRVTEKSTILGEQSRYVVFEVAKNANKFDIKKAVELMFEVKVERVCTINYKGKRKLFQRRAGRRMNWKKAYVKLKQGSEINFVDGRSN